MASLFIWDPFSVLFKIQICIFLLTYDYVIDTLDMNHYSCLLVFIARPVRAPICYAAAALLTRDRCSLKNSRFARVSPFFMFDSMTPRLLLENCCPCTLWWMLG